MQFPWVSRYRLEEAERRLTKVDEERLRLLDLLLDGAQDRARVQTMVAQVEVAKPVEPTEREEIEEPAPVNVEQYSTPFDRIEQRFDKARKSGPISRQFAARIN